MSLRLTTRQKADAALAVPCPEHAKPAGEPCTSLKGVFAGSCMARREAALAILRPAELAEASR